MFSKKNSPKMLMFSFSDLLSSIFLTYFWNVWASDVILGSREIGNHQGFFTDFGN